MLRLLTLIALLGALSLAGCREAAPEAAPETASEPEAPEGTTMVAELPLVLGEDPGDGAVLFAEEVAAQAERLAGRPVLVAGVVAEVCQKAGCWITFREAGAVPVRVRIPKGEDGYAFAFPESATGRHALVAGTLSLEETSIEALRHLAEDRGAGPEELAAITEPEPTIVLTATGARLEAVPEDNA